MRKNFHFITFPSDEFTELKKATCFSFGKMYKSLIEAKEKCLEEVKCTGIVNRYNLTEKMDTFVFCAALGLVRNKTGYSEPIYHKKTFSGRLLLYLNDILGFGN